MNLFPFQQPMHDGLVAALSRHDGVALTTPTGSGKTHVTCSVAKLAGVPLAVVCPKSVVPAWERAAADWGVDTIFVANYEAIKGHYSSKKKKWNSRFANHGSWKVRNRVWQWNLPDRVLLVFDEAHRCRGRTTQNSKMLIAAKRAGISHLLVSATLAESPLQMYSLGFSLGLHTIDDWFAFMVRSGCTKGAFAWEYNGGKAGMERINSQIFPSRGVTARHADLPGFPESFVRAVDIPVEDEDTINEMWARLEELDRIREDDEERAGDDGVNPLVESLRLRQQAELLKVPAMVEMTQDAVSDGTSVVLFVNFKATLEELAARLPEPGIIVGGQSPADRQDAIDCFQADASNIVVVMIQAGGVGISLHDVRGERPRLSLISPGWSSTELIQALGRIHRAGAKSPATQQILTAAGTIESRIRHAINRKVDNLSALTDADLRTW